MTSKFPLPSTTVPRQIVDSVSISNHVKPKEFCRAKPLLVIDWPSHVCEVATDICLISMFVDVCKASSDHCLEFSDNAQNLVKDILKQILMHVHSAGDVHSGMHISVIVLLAHFRHFNSLI